VSNAAPPSSPLVRPPTPAASPAPRTRRPGFVEKSLAGLAANVEHAVFSEEYARRDGLLQRRDPRVKLLAFLVLVTATAISRDWAVLAALYAIVLAGAATSRIGLGMLLKRTWLGVPLFSAVVVAPSIFIVGSHPLLHVPLGFATLTARREGLRAALYFVARVDVSVTLAAVLILTTRWAEILRALRFFRVPNVFVLILSMTYRYLFLFLHTANGMFEARKSRVVAHTSGKEQRWWIVSAMGVLMSRSFRMSDEVYQAMLARGFSGRVLTYGEYELRGADWALGAFACVAAAAAIVVGSRLP
jgi:cobalt/nickel transport system permease protein